MDKDTKMPSLVEANSSYDKREKKTSPAMAMAEASLLSQQAPMKEASNFEALIAFQNKDLFLWGGVKEKLGSEEIKNSYDDGAENVLENVS
jgi:hypothetical protein